MDALSEIYINLQHEKKIGSLFTMKLDKIFYLYIFTEIVLIQGLRFPNKRFMVTKFDYLL